MVTEIPPEPEATYTIEEYQGLSEHDRLLIMCLLQEACPFQPTAPETTEDLTERLSLFLPCDGCVPEDYVSDVDGYIVAKFRDLLAVARMEAVIRVRRTQVQPVIQDFHWAILVTPSTMGETEYAIVDRTEPYCYLLDSDKVWTFQFDSLAAIVQQIESFTSRIEEGYRVTHPTG